MNKPDWVSIKSDYVETTMTLDEVGSKWCVCRGTLSARATRERWRDDKQQFAANLEYRRREKILALRTAEQEQFESNVLKVANGQLATIARHMQESKSDASKILKLANALETVQRIGGTAFERDCP